MLLTPVRSVDEPVRVDTFYYALPPRFWIHRHASSSQQASNRIMAVHLHRSRSRLNPESSSLPVKSVGSRRVASALTLPSKSRGKPYKELLIDEASASAPSSIIEIATRHPTGQAQRAFHADGCIESTQWGRRVDFLNTYRKRFLQGRVVRWMRPVV